jgi:uncharacterized protein (DUF433 family)
MSGERQPGRASDHAMLDIADVVAAFSEEQIERIVGLSKGRLRYWAKTDFFRPTFVGDNPRAPFSRFYSFRDMVALRTLEMLRVQNSVTLQHLRKVAERLAHLKSDLWTTTTLFVVHREVVFVNPESGSPESVLSGQYVLCIPLKKVIEDTKENVINFTRRRDDTLGKITRTRGVVHNRPVVAGTRIPVASIVRFHQDGYSDEAIIAEYPDLTPADIQAALAYRTPKAA